MTINATLVIVLLTALVSWRAFGDRTLHDRLILWPPAIERRKQYDRLLTHGFIHADWMHLIFNMVMLLFIGRQLEAPLGGKAIAVLLVAGAYGHARLRQWALGGVTEDLAGLLQVGEGVREKKMRREAPSYLTSCGLAMRRFML